MMTRHSWAILGLAVLAGAAGGWLQHASRLAHIPDGVIVANVGDIAPDVPLTGLDGQPHRLSEFRGHRVLLNFWATWCAPCIDEMPRLAAAHANIGDRGAIVLGIAMDDPQPVRSFLASHPLDYPVLMGSLTSPSTSLQLGNVGEILPFSVLLDANGRVLANRRGELDATTLANWLAPTAP